MPWDQGEPTLEDVLSEPMVVALMKRDGIELATLRRFIRDLRRSRQVLADNTAARGRAHHGNDAPV